MTSLSPVFAFQFSGSVFVWWAWAKVMNFSLLANSLNECAKIQKKIENEKKHCEFQRVFSMCVCLVVSFAHAKNLCCSNTSFARTENIVCHSSWPHKYVFSWSISFSVAIYFSERNSIFPHNGRAHIKKSIYMCVCLFETMNVWAVE